MPILFTLSEIMNLKCFRILIPNFLSAYFVSFFILKKFHSAGLNASIWICQRKSVRNFLIILLIMQYMALQANNEQHMKPNVTSQT